MRKGCHDTYELGHDAGSDCCHFRPCPWNSRLEAPILQTTANPGETGDLAGLHQVTCNVQKYIYIYIYILFIYIYISYNIGFYCCIHVVVG